MRRVLPALFLLSLATLGGIRWATGTDWDPYWEFYISGGSFQDYMSYWHFEPGFKFVVWLLHDVGVGYSEWLFLLTFLVIAIKFAPIYRRPYILVCFLVLFGMSMADIFPTREAIAVSLVTVSAYYLVERRYLVYLICVVVACLFHSTAIIFLVAPLVLATSYRTLWTLAIVGGLLSKLFLYSAIILVTEHLGLTDLLSAAELYSDSVSGRISLLSIGQKAFILVFSLSVLPKCREKLTPFELASVKLLCFGLISSVILESGSQIFNRLTIYFVSFEVIAVSALIWFYSKYLIERKGYLTLLIVFSAVCIFYAVRFYGLLKNYADLYYPFETVFQSSHRAVY
jgi:transmembrane protein EpsG